MFLRASTLHSFIIAICVNFGIFSLAYAEQFQLETLNVSDGLLSSSITTIHQQQSGYMWFGTDSGASRYDGINFTHFQFSPNEKNHISNNYVTDIYEDKAGNIWIGTEDGLNQLTPTNEMVLHNMQTSQNNLGSSWVTRIYEDKHDNIWIGTGAGISLYNSQTNTFTGFSLFDEDGQQYDTSIYSIFSDYKDTLWVATDYGLTTVNMDTQRLDIVTSSDPDTNKIMTGSINAVEVISDEQVWLGTYQQGLIDFNPKTMEVVAYVIDENNPSIDQIISNTIYDLTLENDNTLWLAHDKGATKVTLDTMSYTHLQHQAYNPSSIADNIVGELQIDQSGGIWFATAMGASYYSPFKHGTRIFRPHPFSPELSSPFTYWINTDKSKDVWVTTSEKINLISDKTEAIKLNPIEDASISSPYSAIKDDKENLWIASANGLSVFNTLNETLTHYSNALDNPHDFPNSPFYLALPDNNGDVWITGYLDVGLILFNPQEGIKQQLLTEHDFSYAAGGNFTFDKQFIHNGELWLATTNAIYRVNPETFEVKHLSLGSETENIRTVKLYQDENNHIWVATQGLGLARIEMGEMWQDPVEIKYFNKEQGFTSNTLRGVTGNRDGFVWVTSQSKFAKMNIDTFEVTQYPSATNEKGSSFTDSAIAMKNDNLYLGSNNGLYKINTKAIKSNRFKPKVHITSALIANEQFLGPNSNQKIGDVQLDYEQNIVQFSFASMDFTAPYRNQYRYRLLGFDDEWIYAGSHTSATYTNLNAGLYSFVAQGSNSDGRWSPNVASFDFKVKQAWWFYAIIILIIICAFLAILYLYTRYQKITELSNRANFDSLTGLSNRFRFNAKLELTVNDIQKPAAVVFIDLDYFKEVNDTMGHDIGDELIIEVSKRLSNTLKEEDLLARLGGDEFAIIIQHPGTQAKLINIIEQIRSSINTGYQIKEHWITSSASIGVACFPEDGVDCKTLLKHADTAMYAAKHAGRNGAYFFNESLSQALLEKTTIKQQLKNALINKQFQVHYQPKVNMVNGEVCSFEALLRWYHPTEGLISPVKFIPEAESNGQIIEIGYWVLLQACTDGQKWHQQGLLKDNISVNISPIQLSQPDICEHIAEILAQTGFPAEKLELEITESLLIENFDTAEVVLKQLKKLNVRIALDDFGTGFSSLNYLTHFPIDTLKIDQGFLKNLLDNQATEIVLKNIIQLGIELNMNIVAEGIEADLQRAKLIELGCLTGQGYLFSPAVTEPTASEILVNRRSLN
ncbi:EAL domain-containing protein [Shewanella electrodiphila]|uniref:EAL domain-containing protein n=1 Tax=Shewanella electrodiphila TaxID=934143 RepID=A0ABT0KLI2_9GAMM|nr:EAL domain-containing protein [Shewanella electrodiphila]MCL1044629.1 EAL domain-containing protein [Shewanella electrodiphila]